MRLQLLRKVIGWKISRQFFNQWEAKPKPIAPCTPGFSRALNKLKVILGDSDWFITSVVIGRSNCFGIGCVHMTSRRPFWRSKQRNGGHVRGVKYPFLGIELHFYANYSFCFIMQMWFLVTWANTLYWFSDSYLKTVLRSKNKAKRIIAIVTGRLQVPAFCFDCIFCYDREFLCL